MRGGGSGTESQANKRGEGKEDAEERERSEAVASVEWPQHRVDSTNTS